MCSVFQQLKTSKFLFPSLMTSKRRPHIYNDESIIKTLFQEFLGRPPSLKQMLDLKSIKEIQPLIPYCTYYDQKMEGWDIGYERKMCNEFSYSLTDQGICLTSGLERNILKDSNQFRSSGPKFVKAITPEGFLTLTLDAGTPFMFSILFRQLAYQKFLS